MKIFITLIFSAFLLSCSTMKIATDFDKTVDFTSLKTYAFTPETNEIGLNDLDKKRLISATETNLSKKDFSKSDNPDVLIDISLITQQKQSLTTTNNGYYGRYRYAGGMSYTTVENYTEGTLIISMIDPVKNELIWMGSATATLEPNSNPERKEARINEAVEMILYKYPPVIK